MLACNKDTQRGKTISLSDKCFLGNAVQNLICADFIHSGQCLTQMRTNATLKSLSRNRNPEVSIFSTKQFFCMLYYKHMIPSTGKLLGLNTGMKSASEPTWMRTATSTVRTGGGRSLHMTKRISYLRISTEWRKKTLKFSDKKGCSQPSTSLAL